MNLIITCARHLEPETTSELSEILELFGDENPEIFRTHMSGVLTAKTKLDPFEIIKKIREKINDEPWSIRYCLRVIPIERVVETNFEEISSEVLSLMKRLVKMKLIELLLRKEIRIFQVQKLFQKLLIIYQIRFH